MLVIVTHCSVKHLADNGHDWMVVQIGVVETVQQVDVTRSRSGLAHSHLTSELGVGHRP